MTLSYLLELKRRQKNGQIDEIQFAQKRLIKTVFILIDNYFTGFLITQVTGHN